MGELVSSSCSEWRGEKTGRYFKVLHSLEEATVTFKPFKVRWDDLHEGEKMSK